MLTAEQMAKRGEIGASDVPTIMCGKAEQLVERWRVLCGLDAPPDFTSNWPVQYGSHMEAFILDWHQRKLGYDLIERGEVFRHPKLNYLTCTLDAYDPKRDAVIEAKTTAWSADWAVGYYASQLYVQRACRGAKNAIMLISVAAAEPVEIEFDFDQTFYDEMISRIGRFKTCIETLTPPVLLPMMIPQEKWRSVDLNSETPNWRDEMIEQLECWAQTRNAAAQHEQAADDAKALIPPDVGRLLFKDITIKRDKRGRLAIRGAA